jgi:hypothetical protein
VHLHSLLSALDANRSFAGKLEIKAGQCNAKGLYGTQRILVVQGERVPANTPKLHGDVVN